MLNRNMYLQEIEFHRCNKVAPRVFECPNCDRVFPHQKYLDVHISNGWCAPKFSKPGFERVTDESEAAKRFKVLTGKDPNIVMLPVKKIKPKVVTDPKKNGLTQSSASTVTKAPKFSISDRQILTKYSVSSSKNRDLFKNSETNIRDDLPATGNIFVGTKARGVNSEIRRDIKEIGKSFRIRETAEQLDIEILRAGSNFFLESKLVSSSQTLSDSDSEMNKKSGKEDEETPDQISETEQTPERQMSPIRIKMFDPKLLKKEKPENISVKVNFVNNIRHRSKYAAYWFVQI